VTTKYTIAEFIADAKKILAGPEPLEEKKKALGEPLMVLARRDDLFRFGKPIGHTDASNVNFLLYREPPNITLILAGWLPGYGSPVHEHGNYWAVGAGYAGHDRWDMYERFDDGSKPGYADVRMIDQWHITPGKFVCMPAPPRAIHSHNNMASELTYELIFLGAPSPGANERLIYDVDGKACWPTWRSISDAYAQPWPTRMPDPAAAPAQATGISLAAAIRNKWKALNQRMMCPICTAIDTPGLFTPTLLTGLR